MAVISTIDKNTNWAGSLVLDLKQEGLLVNL